MPANLPRERIIIADFFSSDKGNPLVEKFAQASVYLSDPNYYRVALTELENNLLQDFQMRVFAHFKTQSSDRLQALSESIMGDLRQGFLPPEATKKLLGKLLTAALEDFETKANLQHGPSGKADLLIGSPTRAFNKQLEGGRPFKDMGADANHGENAHRFQWYLLGKSEYFKADFRKMFTDIPKRKYAVPGASTAYLWNYLVDRDGLDGNAVQVPFKTTEATDFRAPSNLTSYFRTSVDSRFPLLNLVFARKYEKRKNFNAPDYYAKKKFGKEQLTEKQLGDFLDNSLLKGEFIKR